MRVLLSGVIALVAMVAPASAGNVSSGSIPACMAPTAKLGAGNKQVSAVGGKCVVNKKAVRTVIFFQYVEVDQAGNSCSTVPVRRSGRLYTLKREPFGLKFRFGIAAKTHLKRVKWAKWRTFTIAGFDLQCRKLTPETPLPTQAQLCAWPDGDVFQPPLVGGCGNPVPGHCAWIGTAALVNNLVMAGQIACPRPPCDYRSDIRPVTWFTSTPITTAVALYCPGNTGAIVGLGVIRLAHYEGDRLVIDCEARPDAWAVIGFEVPAQWGGVLMVDFFLMPYGVGADGVVRPVRQIESQTSLFRLNGSQSGCPLKLAPING